MPSLSFVIHIGIYLAVGWLCLRISSYRIRAITFALLNIIGTYYLFQWTNSRTEIIRNLFIYLTWISFQYLAMRYFAQKDKWLPWIAFLLPIVGLLSFRFLHIPQLQHLSPYFIGLSYMAFRLSHLVLEVRNQRVPLPSYAEYLSYALFIPTISVGPISPYSTFHKSLNFPMTNLQLLSRSALRITVGIAKYVVLANLCNQLAFENLFGDARFHPRIDLVISSIAYFLYLYCNFSGFCDLVIGAAGILGIEVAENFENPFAARNVKDFWNRWHITLSQYMRDMVFTPLTKLLVSCFGPGSANHAIAFSVGIVFLLVGVWHGTAWHFFWFGAAHAVGVVVNHYYTILLKYFLGKQRLKTYNESRLIRAVAMATTFVYVSGTFFLFANNEAAAKRILDVVR